MKAQKTLWECTSCGHTQNRWTGSCSNCNSWNSFVEQIIFQEKNKRFESKNTTASKPVRITEVQMEDFERINSKISEFDRLMGGGVVRGSLILIAGEPGIGKSTLLLQISEAFSKNGKKVLYISGEESLKQISLRAKRLNIKNENLFLLSETLFSAIKAEIDILKPDIIIVDSVQIMYKTEIPSSPGSVVQVREITTEFMHLCKGNGITSFLIGHVTKSGDIAGPRVLEHLVDTVLEFEGDKEHGYRLLRSIKNRFGPTDDLAIFQMQETGLVQVENPSKAFLEERQKEVSGSCIVATLEGCKSILIEIQALVTHSVFPSPARRCSGIDQNRLALLIAVLEKKLGFKLYTTDIFVSIAGGMKVVEPAIDLAIVGAISSSFSSRSIDKDTVVFGEVGLNGEIRSVARSESRVKEAINMGFKRCILPKKNLGDLYKNFHDKIELIGVNMVNEAIDLLI